MTTEPDIYSTDQGARLAADEFTGVLDAADIRISIDGRGRALDNVFVERLWRTIKYGSISLVDYASVPDLEMGSHAYCRFHNHERLHQSLD